MPVTKRVVRGLQNMKTLSGRKDDAAAPYKDYMRISILEMEKYRKNKEKESAQERLRAIAERFQEIEIEKQKMLRSLETRAAAMPRSQGPTESAEISTEGAEPFRFRY